mgnify:FL=1|jgi:hypothetical protein
MSSDYNLFALGGLPGYYQTDEETIESFKTFPKKLLHTADMNLWITWIVYLNNIKANYEAIQNNDLDGAGEKWLPSYLAEKNDQGKPKYTKEQAMKKAAEHQAEVELISHISNMQIIISGRYWHEMNVPFNQYQDGLDPEPDWYADYGNVKSASYYCYRNNPQEYAGFIEADEGISLGTQTDGKWKLNPTDDYWKTDESIERYRKHLGYVNTSGLNQEDAYHVAFDLLKINFGENNLPPWSQKIKDWFKLYK